MIGTLTNSIAIISRECSRGAIGRKVLKDKYRDMLYIAMSLATTGLGIETFAKNMMNSKIPVLFIISLALGGVIGIAVSSIILFL